MKLPFIKFYPRDWQADPELRMCSLESRGLWFELLLIMHSAKRRGYLETTQGAPLNVDDISRLIGTFKGDVYRCMEELLKAGVPSVCEESGTWYCRRMVNESRKAEKCSLAGRRGGGSPKLRNNTTKTDIPEARSHISLKVTFKGAIDALRKEQSIENAISAIYASNESFLNVNRLHLENSLAAQPDKTKWIEAIEGLAAKYAGVQIEYPNRTLQNWLTGKQANNQRASKDPVGYVHFANSQNKDDYEL